MDQNKLKSAKIFSHKPRQRERAPTNQKQCSCEGSIRTVCASERARMCTLAPSLHLFVFSSFAPAISLLNWGAGSFYHYGNHPWESSTHDHIKTEAISEERGPADRGAWGGWGAEKLRRRWGGESGQRTTTSNPTRHITEDGWGRRQAEIHPLHGSTNFSSAFHSLSGSSLQLSLFPMLSFDFPPPFLSVSSQFPTNSQPSSP